MSGVRPVSDDGRTFMDDLDDIEHAMDQKYPSTAGKAPNGTNGAHVEEKPAPPLLAFEAALLDWASPLPAAIPTGITELDKMIGGLRAESVYVLNAPTGRGKTGLAIQMASHAAKTRPVLYLSSELSRRQILARFVAQRLQCSWLEVYGFEPTGAKRVAEELCKVPRLRAVELTRETNITDLCKRVADAEGQPPLLVLDYLQHAARRMNPDDRRLATGALSDEIARYARDNRSAALVVSAVARGFYNDNQDKTAADFAGASKESGDIDYDAAGLFFLDCELCPPGGTSPARLHVSKSRFSHGGTIGLEFNGRVGVFKSDPAGALTDEQRSVYDVIRGGVDGFDDLYAGIKMRKQRVLEIVKILSARHLITRTPLAVVPQ